MAIVLDQHVMGRLRSSSAIGANGQITMGGKGSSPRRTRARTESRRCRSRLVADWRVIARAGADRSTRASLQVSSLALVVPGAWLLPARAAVAALVLCYPVQQSRACRFQAVLNCRDSRARA